MAPHVPQGVHFVPGHPIAGTEQSGPEAGFAELFDGRWSILTPEPGTDAAAVDKLKAFWTELGSKVEIMSAPHHDMVLAITSHLPHLIAYNIVNTAEHLERVTDKEVIKFSAGGFRDFTRIAASDPTMWRDVFLNNKEAVMEMLRRFSDDLAELQRAIEGADGDTLFQLLLGRAHGAPRHHRCRPGHGGARLRPHAGSPAWRIGNRTRRAQIAMADAHDLWIFAYGSLMWRPGFASEEIGARPPRRLAPQLLHLLALSSRLSTAPRPGAGARPRRHVRGTGVPRVGGQCARRRCAICASASRWRASIARRWCR